MADTGGADNPKRDVRQGFSRRVRERSRPGRNPDIETGCGGDAWLFMRCACRRGWGSARPAASSGANLLAVRSGEGWELVQFRRAELVGGDVWRLSGLLRGQQGTEEAAARGAEAGALVVVLERGMARAEVDAVERGLPRIWRAGPAGAPPGGAGTTEVGFIWTNRNAAPWRPAHLRATPEDSGWRLSWTPRVRLGGGGLDSEPVEVDPRRFRVRVLDGAVGAGSGRSRGWRRSMEPWRLRRTFRGASGLRRTWLSPSGGMASAGGRRRRRRCDNGLPVCSDEVRNMRKPSSPLSAGGCMA